MDASLAASLSRIEDAGINASAPREQLWVDGWLVRLSPGKAKRARCVQAVADGRLGLDERLDCCRRHYRQAGLPLHVRVTPFSQPPGLDARLAERGMVRVDDTRVMVAQLPLAGEPPAASRAPAPIDVRDVDAAAFVAWLGAQRGSSAVEIAAHAARLRDSPVAYRALAAVDGEGRIVAGGQVAIEDDMAGLYDVATDPAWRRRGLCERICRELLQMAHRAGVVTAYLQVDAANAGARSVYARLGFADAYGYHYRSMPPS